MLFCLEYTEFTDVTIKAYTVLSINGPRHILSSPSLISLHALGCSVSASYTLYRKKTGVVMTARVKLPVLGLGQELPPALVRVRELAQALSLQFPLTAFVLH